MGHLINFIPNVKLTNELYQESMLHDIIQNKTVILNMFYSNCQIKCIPLGNLMKRVNLLLNKHIIREDIVFISITLDSKNDTIDDLNKFKKEVFSDQCLNWHFYTGDYDDIEVFRHKLSMYSPEPEIDKDISNHSGNFMIFNMETGFTKHTESFDNPLDIARKVVQMTTKNFYRHSYNLHDLNYDALSDEEIFENIHSINSMFTIPFLPDHIRNKYDKYAELQRGFQYVPPIGKSIQNTTQTSIKSPCCCKNKNNI